MSKLTRNELCKARTAAIDIMESLKNPHRDCTRMVEDWDYLNDKAAPPRVVKSMADELLNLRKCFQVQKTRIAEQQTVIDQRTGECDRLINELAALRASTKLAESYPDDADLKFTIDWYDDERSDDLQMAMWLKELRRRREQAAPVTVPDSEGKAIASKVHGICSRLAGATFSKAAELTIDEVLRLNRGVNDDV